MEAIKKQNNNNESNYDYESESNDNNINFNDDANDLQNIDKIIPQEIKEFLKNLLEEISLTVEQKNKFMREIANFTRQLQQDHLENFMVKEQELKDKIQNNWGENYDKNIVFLKRAFKWLGINNFNDVEGIVSLNFINKIVDVGKMLSEDNNIGEGEDNFNLTASEAINMRNKITSDKDFSNIIFNKMHPARAEIMEKLNYLNDIIAQSK